MRSGGGVGFIWGSAWLAFAALWVAFLTLIIQTEAGTPAFYGVCLAAGGPTLPIGWLAARVARHFPLSRFTARVALGAALAAALLAVVFRGRGGVGEESLWLAGYAFFGPFWLALSGAAFRLGWPRTPLWPAAILYVALGLFLLLPAPPISARSYNPVGLFFPFWGLGAPGLVTMWGLARFLKRSRRTQPR